MKAVKASHIVKNEEGEEVTLTYGKDYDQEVCSLFCKIVSF